MTQVGIETVGGRTVKQDGGEFAPVTRSLTVATRASAAAMVNSAAVDAISSLSLAGVRQSQEKKLSCTEPAPVWMAALRAVGCQARSNGLHHDIGWHAVAGRVDRQRPARDAAQIDMTEFFNFDAPPWLTPPIPPVQPINKPCDYTNLK